MSAGASFVSIDTLRVPMVLAYGLARSHGFGNKSATADTSRRARDMLRFATAWRLSGYPMIANEDIGMLRKVTSHLAALWVCLSVFAPAVGAQTTTAAPATRQAAEDPSIRPFKVQVPQAALDDLRRRIAATRWPDKETVADRSQGAQLAKLQELVRYWGSGYDWRKAEAKLNALPQFMTNIDGVDIHFIHVRSRHQNALPVIVTHGWPGSVIEQLKIIGPLTDPTAHGGTRRGRFRRRHPVLAGLRLLGQADGHRLGSRPHRASLGRADEAPRIHPLRRAGRRLGHARSPARWRARRPPGLLGIHINLPATVPPEVAAALARRARAGGALRKGTRGVRSAR